MRIIHVDNYKDFLGLKEIWNDTLRRCKNSSVFSTWEWLTLWWKHFGMDKELLLLLAEDGGKIVGIAPLMYSMHILFGLRIKKIEFIGTGASDYCDFVLGEKGEECVKAFMDYLTRIPQKWDYIELKDIPGAALSLNILKRMSNGVKLANELMLYECPYMPLPRSLSTFMNSLSSKLRKNLRRTAKQLEKDFEVDFVDCSKVQTFEQGMNAFFDLHQRRWTAKGGRGIFSDRQACNFHMDVARSFSQRSWLGLFLLRLSGTPVAANYGFIYQSRFFYYLSGFDPRYSKYGVASLLIEHVIANCVQQGLVEFDFLRGAEEYKGRWNTLARWNHEAILTKKGFLGGVRNRLYREYWHHGGRIKYLLRTQS